MERLSTLAYLHVLDVSSNQLTTINDIEKLHHVWCEWAEMELRHTNFKGALELMRHATAEPSVKVKRREALIHIPSHLSMVGPSHRGQNMLLQQDFFSLRDYTNEKFQKMDSFMEFNVEFHGPKEIGDNK